MASQTLYYFDVNSPPTLITAPFLILCGGAIFFAELYFVHGNGNLFDARPSRIAESNCHQSLPAEIRYRYWLFASRRFPLTTTLLLLGPILSLSSMAWLGLLDRQVWVDRILRVLILSFAYCMPCALLAHNAISLRRYLPASWYDWNNNARLLSWWGWIAIKLVLGNTDQWQIIFTTLWYLSLIWFTWPFRYFFHYRQSIFTANPTSADIFVLNMTMHAALLVGWSLYLHMVTFGSVRIVSHKFRTKYCIQLTFLLTICNTAICLLRILWFMAANIFVLSFWGQWVVLSFLNLHVIVDLGVLNLYYGINQREQAWLHLRNAFLEHYIHVHLNTRGSDCSIESVQEIRSALTAEADGLLTDLLDSTCRRFVFREAKPRRKSPEDSAEEKAEENGGDEDADQAKVFLSFMTETLAIEVGRWKA